jgi:hypothetical protein
MLAKIEGPCSKELLESGSHCTSGTVEEWELGLRVINHKVIRMLSQVEM